MHISANLAPIEPLVRGIFRPLFYSSNALKPLAFMPGPDRVDVSVLRLIYTSANFCKKHSSTIGINNNDYIGLAVISAQMIHEANALVSQAGLDVTVVATPLRVDKSVRDFSEEILSDDEGLPMHADLVYSLPRKRGEVNPEMQIVARYLLSKAVYYNDPDVASDTWTGGALVARLDAAA